LLNLVYTSQINGFEDIELHLSFSTIPLALTIPLNRALRELQISDPPQSFQQLIFRFLKGTGIPCPQKFEQAKAHFNNIASLENINQAGFLPRVLCWAATGSPSLDITMEDKILVRLLYF